MPTGTIDATQTPKALLHPSLPSAAGLPSWRVLRRRMELLQITAQDLEGLTTFGTLQRLARARYRVLSTRYHPDAMRSPRHPHPEQGYRFQRITATYRWVCAFPPTAALPARGVVPPLVYDTPPLRSLALPWARQPRLWALPEGFQLLPHWTDERTRQGPQGPAPQAGPRGPASRKPRGEHHLRQPWRPCGCVPMRYSMGRGFPQPRGR